MDLAQGMVVVLVVVFGLGLSAAFIGLLFALITAIGKREWGWVLAIVLTWPLAASCYAVARRRSDPRLGRLLLPGVAASVACLLVLALLAHKIG
ncbi:hypothetical protein [Paludibacterium yongneupense]|uniref:hypothetical protein n=1 Tax=Paludibacterium yongneupense TaxID=400061 RepID=UPI00048D6B99|nr:hypothetical protein [Paludibacterium yongneupense]